MSPLFRKREDTPNPRNPQVRQILAGVASELAGVQWVALISVDGMPVDTYAVHAKADPDRISAMSAAMLSLGERIAKEHGHGEYDFTLVAGQEGMAIAIALSREYVLSVGLGRDISVDAVLDQLGRSIQALQMALRITEALRK